jgi:hypothetical protein
VPNVIQAGASDIDENPDRIVSLNHQIRAACYYSRLTPAALEQPKCLTDGVWPIESLDLVEHKIAKP